MAANTTCRACGARIAFVRTSRGKLLPVDAEPVLVVRRGGTMTETIVTDAGEVIRGFPVTEQPDPEIGFYEGRRPHWVSCPASEEFRRR